MRRRALPGAALALALLVAAPAAADPNTVEDAHRHPGLLFRIRVEPELNTAWVYRAFLRDPADLSSLLVERSDNWLGDRGQTDLTPSTCPALRGAVAALADLSPPAVALDGERRYVPEAARAEQYRFDGFLHFANGGEGEISFTSYDLPGRPRDLQLEWMRGLVRAFDACRRREPPRD
jgi:hypothetical protein